MLTINKVHNKKVESSSSTFFFSFLRVKSIFLLLASYFMMLVLRCQLSLFVIDDFNFDSISVVETSERPRFTYIHS